MPGNLTPPERIGRLDTLGYGYFRWTIDDFPSRAVLLSSGESRFSPIFKFLYRSYIIRLNLSKIGMHLFLGQLCKSPLRRLRVEIRIEARFLGMSENHRGEFDDSGYFKRIVLFPVPKCGRLEVVTEGLFTLFLTLRSLDAGGDTSSLGIRLSAINKLHIDLRNLLVSGEGCDVKIKVQGKEFNAHRNILRARSPVFNSMFSHDMVEKQSGVVVIDDCDPATFPDFLNYVYTGSTGHICNENVISLFTASDKYGVEELKEGCAAFMKSNMSIGMFCDVFTLALRHGEKELVELATGFFCENAKEIIKTTKWQTFLRENSTAGNELFIKLLSK